jgi:hypothetical protein
MTLSNWLTRDEWNAVYFAGMGEALDGKKCKCLGDHMKLGIAALVRAGYRFCGIDADPEGNYEKRRPCSDGNETVLAELIGEFGGFDKLGRAKEAVAFAEKEIPKLDFGWLKDGIADAEAGFGAAVLRKCGSVKSLYR